MAKFKAIYHDPKSNPFRGSGIRRFSKTVEVPDDTPLVQVEAWAREAQESYRFIELQRLEK